MVYQPGHQIPSSIYVYLHQLHPDSIHRDSAENPQAKHKSMSQSRDLAQGGLVGLQEKCPNSLRLKRCLTKNLLRPKIYCLPPKTNDCSWEFQGFFTLFVNPPIFILEVPERMILSETPCANPPVQKKFWKNYSSAIFSVNNSWQQHGSFRINIATNIGEFPDLEMI